MHTEPESISLEITAKSDPPLIMAALYRPPATGKNGNEYIDNLTTTTSINLCAKYSGSLI